MSLRRDTVQGALSALVTLGSRIALTALLARALGPSAYGELMFAQWVMEMLLLVAGLGAPAMLTRFLPGLSGRRDAAAHRVRRWLLLACGLAFLLCLLGFAAWLAIGSGQHTRLDPAREGTALLLMCASYLAVSFVTPLLQGLLRYDAVLYGSLASAIAAPLLVYTLVRPGNVADGALALATALALNVIVSVVWLRGRRDDAVAVTARDDDLHLRVVAGYAANSWAAGLVAGMVWMRGELGVLKLQASSAGIAFYSGALTLAGAVTQVASLVLNALQPHLVTARHEHDTARVVEMLRTATQAALLLTTLCAFALLTFSEQLVNLLLGDGFLAATPIVEILAIMSVASASGGAATLLQVETNGRFTLMSNAVAAVLLLALSLALTPLVGVLGAAIARGLAQACVAELVYRRLRDVDGFAIAARQLARAQRSAIALLLVVWTAGSLWGKAPAISFGVGVPCLLAALALVRASAGIPIARMLRLGSRPG